MKILAVWFVDVAVKLTLKEGQSGIWWFQSRQMEKRYEEATLDPKDDRKQKRI